MASAKMSVTSTLQTMLLNKSLSSMVKGIRNHKSENGGSKAQEQEYINKCMAEIKEELKTSFPDVKAVAIQKLIYVSQQRGKRWQRGGSDSGSRVHHHCILS